jgi:hypothetical protein
MSKARQFAPRLIAMVMKCVPAEGRSWGTAMLREMDRIESDRDLLSWAIGSATALFRYSVATRIGSFCQALGNVERSQLEKGIEGIFSGLGMAAAVLGVCVLAYSRLLRYGGWELRWTAVLDGLLIFVLPEAGYAFAIALLWKQKRSTALGILTAAAILFTHVLIHHATHA